MKAGTLVDTVALALLGRFGPRCGDRIVDRPCAQRFEYSATFANGLASASA
jgi:hypothetical protein